MNPLELIQLNFEKFTKKDLLIAKFILNDPRLFIRGTIDSVTEKMGVSKAALIRFCKKIGYSGYSEYINDLTKFLIENNTSDEVDTDNINNIANLYSNITKELANSIDRDTFKRFVDDFLTSRLVYSLGFNRTGLSARQLSYRSWSISVPSHAITDDAILMVDHIRSLNSNDLVIIFTTNDNTKNFAKNVPAFKETGCKVVAITANKDLSFLSECDYYFLFPSGLRKYGTFNDEQVLYYIFIEMLIYELGKGNNRVGSK